MCKFVFFFIFIRNNSEKLRIAAATKQKNEISVMNYNKIQEKERFIKEQRIKNIELANLKNMEIFKNQVKINHSL